MSTINRPDPKYAATVLVFIFTLFPTESISPQESRGFSLELVTRNLTELKSSQSSGNTTTTATISPPLILDQLIYMVSVKLGTGESRQTYELLFDTGSSLTWTQCEPCAECFPQTAPKFNPAKSPTYQNVPCHDPLCASPWYHCEQQKCTYNRKYGDGSNVEGILARDTFTFDAKNSHQAIPHLAFGCTHTSKVLFNGKPEGVMGMGAREESFVNQLSQFTLRRFSYCLPDPRHRQQTYLRFGEDAIIGRGQSTGISVGPRYYLTLQDVSVNGVRLQIPPGTFAPRRDGTGGCFLDTGTTLTHFTDVAYRRIKGALLHYFTSLKLTPKEPRPPRLDLCYMTPDNWSVVRPSITLHFQGADFNIKGEDLLLVKPDFFCVGMLSDNSHTIVGAYQQYNTRFTYDLQKGKLWFESVNCAMEGQT